MFRVIKINHMKKLVIVLFCISLGINAQQKEFLSTVSVTGESTLFVTPDYALIRVSVEHNGNDPQSVKANNDAVINTVFKIIKKHKIKDKDVFSERVNLNKRFDYQKKKYHYTASQSLKITLRDLSKYEALMQGLLNSGINRIDGVQFKASNLEEVKSQARIKAILNAKEKAVAYAQALGQQTGKAITISESGYSAPMPVRSYEVKAMAMDAAEEIQTIAAGDIEIKARVYVVFELK